MLNINRIYSPQSANAKFPGMQATGISSMQSLRLMASKIFLLIFVAVLTATVGIAAEINPFQSDRVLSGDFNADGRSDRLLQGETDENTHRLHISGHGIVQDWRDGYLFLNWSQTHSKLIVGDYNGDGQADVFLQGHGDVASHVVLTAHHAESDESYIGEPQQIIDPYHLGIRWQADSHRLYSGDFNGDGRSDLLLQAHADIDFHAIALADERGQFQYLSQQFDNHHLDLDWQSQSHRPIIGDFNGDGYSDVFLHSRRAGPANQPSLGDHAIVLADHEGQLQSISQRFNRPLLEVDWYDPGLVLKSGDFNGDGQDDLLLSHPQRNQLQIIYIEGGRLQRLATLPEQIDPAHLQDLLVGDIDGDGVSDIAAYYPDRPPQIIGKDAATAQAIKDLLLVRSPFTALDHTPVVSESASSVIAASQQQTMTVNVMSGAGESGAAAMTPVTAVGVLPAEASVSGGAGSYHIPIQIPPGRNGVQPDVALNYNSRGGNGLAGVGWSLSAGGSIHRCPRTVAQDGKAAGVAFDNNDKLCLDGARLQLVSGVYAAHGARYKTEIDNGLLVEQQGGIDSATSLFTVRMPSGRAKIYGGSGTHITHNGGGSAPLTWLLANEQDLNGNRIDYDYAITAITGEWYLQQIDYTGSGNTSGDRHIIFEYENRPDALHNFLAGHQSLTRKRLKTIRTQVAARKVYEYRLDYVLSAVTDRSLVSAVQLCAYTADNQTAPDCLQPTTFTWQDAALQYQTAALQYSGELSGQYVSRNVVLSQDFNGDGVREVFVTDHRPELRDVYGNITQTEITRPKVLNFNAEGEVVSARDYTDYFGQNDHRTHLIYSDHYADFDSDGRPDMLVADTQTPSNAELLLGSWNPANGRLDHERRTGIFINEGPDFSNKAYVTDFNADGKLDILLDREVSDQVRKLYLYLNNGTATDPRYTGSPVLLYSFASVQTQFYVGGIGEINLWGHESVRALDDMNGDGYPDISLSIAYLNGPFVQSGFADSTRFNNKFLLNTQNNTLLQKYYTAQGIHSSYNPEKTYHHWLDVNGDGLKDYVFLPNKASTAPKQWHYQLNTGGTFAAAVNTGSDVGYWGKDNCPRAAEDQHLRERCENRDLLEPKYATIIRPQDLDSDGKAELLTPASLSGALMVNYCKERIQTINPPGGQPPGGEPIIPQFDCSDAHDDRFTLPGGQHHDIYDEASGWDRGIYRASGYRFQRDASGIYRLVKLNGAGVLLQPKHLGPLNDGEDFYGDGLGDFYLDRAVIYKGESFHSAHDFAGLPAGKFLLQRNLGAAATSAEKMRAPDLLVKAAQGEAQSFEWTYRPLSSDEYSSAELDFYTPDHAYMAQDNEYLHFTSSMYVVAEYKIPNGLGGHNVQHYFYEGAAYHNQGRGFQGFRKITIKDIKGIYQESVFHQRFPLTGRLESRRRYFYNGGSAQTLSLETHDWASRAAVYGGATRAQVHIPYRTETIQRLYDLDSGDVLNTTTTTVSTADIDGYGNIRREQIVQEDIYQTHTQLRVKTFDPQESGWWPDKLTQEAVTATLIYKQMPFPEGQAQHSQTRSTNFSYTLGGPCKRRPTQTDTEGVVTTLSCHDDGNPHQLSTIDVQYSGLDAALTHDRDITTIYTADGYFPRQITNNLNHTLTLATDPAHGQVILETDVNSVQTQIEYDAFGRETRRQQQSGAEQLPARITEYLSCRTSSGAVSIACDGLAHAWRLSIVSQAGHPTQKEILNNQGRPLRSKIQAFIGAGFYNRSFQYDRFERLFSEGVPGDAAAVTFHDYDLLDRPAQKHLPGVNGSLQIAYDYNGLETTVTVAGDTSQSYSVVRHHNGTGRLMQTLDAADNPSYFRYTPWDEPALIQDSAQNQISASYNSRGHKTTLRDPDRGVWHYHRNILGELLSQTDGNDVTTQYRYDPLGRPTARHVEGLQTAAFTYDSRGLGLLASEVGYEAGNAVYQRDYHYNDAFKRLSATTTQISVDGQPYNFSVEHRYNSLGQLELLSYPGASERLQLKHHYQNGYLKALQKADSSLTYQTITARDAFGHIQTHTTGNGLIQQRASSARTGQLQWLCLNRYSDCQVSDLDNLHAQDYDYDRFGNLIRQTDPLQDIHETYRYENANGEGRGLHRLLQATLGATLIDGSHHTQSVHYQYDARGNLTYKSDHGYYHNGADADALLNQPSGTFRPHQVGAVTDDLNQLIAQYAYDGNGNLIQGAGRTLTYNSDNKPLLITQSNRSAAFKYSPSGQRYYQRSQADGQTVTTFYIDKLYEQVTVQSATQTYIEEKHYISDIALYTKRSTGTQCHHQLRYLHSDRLGSIVAVSDPQGHIIERRSYDPFGQPRQIHGFLLSRKNQDPTDRLGLFMRDTTRGFTGHEHLDAVSLIHMNGRAYDPQLGRFLSVDPLIQAPENSQSLNPYSYIMNNPLSGTDPSGYTSCDAGESMSGCIKDLVKGGGAQIKQSVSGSRIKADIGMVTKNHNGSITVSDAGGNSLTLSAADNGNWQIMSANRAQTQGVSGPTEVESTGSLQATNRQGQDNRVEQADRHRQGVVEERDNQGGFADTFSSMTGGLGLGDAISQYNALTGESLTADTVEKLFTDPAFAKTELLANKNLHTTFRDILNANVPATKTGAGDAGWTKMPFYKNLFHGWYKGNVKFVAPDGHMEAVYNGSGARVIDNAHKGTFNFYDPNTNASGHWDADVAPYNKWGN